MTSHSTARPTLAAPTLAALTLIGALGLSGCSGISGLDKARAMTPEQIAMQSDDFVCERLRTFGYIADVPVDWLREAQNRKLENCIDQGMARRRAEDSNQGRFGCDRFAVTAVQRCY